MERGEFRQKIEAVSENHGGDSIERQADKLAVKLIDLIAKEASAGKKWATMEYGADLNSPSQLHEQMVVMARVSQFIQEEGFQTDDAYHEEDGRRIRQLTVFWSDGKDVYEHELHMLGQQNVNS